MSIYPLWNNDKGDADMSKEIEIYSLPTWPTCIKTKAYLDSLGLHYVDHNVAEDPNAKEEMIERSSQMTVPTLFIDNELVVGFDQEKIDWLLK